LISPSATEYEYRGDHIYAHAEMQTVSNIFTADPVRTGNEADLGALLRPAHVMPRIRNKLRQ
jgi:hypothetical protein